MKEKKKYEKPRIIEITKIEAIAAGCPQAKVSKAVQGACTVISS